MLISGLRALLSDLHDEELDKGGEAHLQKFILLNASKSRQVERNSMQQPGHIVWDLICSNRVRGSVFIRRKSADQT